MLGEPNFAFKLRKLQAILVWFFKRILILQRIQLKLNSNSNSNSIKLYFNLINLSVIKNKKKNDSYFSS